MKKWIFISILALSAIVCNLGAPAPTTAPPTLDVGAASTLIAAATGTAAAQSTPTLSTTPMSSFPETGTITGKLNYPADSLPAMRIAAFDVATGQVSYMDTAVGQPTYSFELPVGTYHIVSYSIAGGAFPGGLASGYTRAVICGLAVECADHALIDVVVAAGATIPDINPGDSYAPEGSFPPMPGE